MKISAQDSSLVPLFLPSLFSPLFLEVENRSRCVAVELNASSVHGGRGFTCVHVLDHTQEMSCAACVRRRPPTRYRSLGCPVGRVVGTQVIPWGQEDGKVTRLPQETLAGVQTGKFLGITQRSEGTHTVNWVEHLCTWGCGRDPPTSFVCDIRGPEATQTKCTM